MLVETNLLGNLTPGPHLVAATAPGLLPTEVTAYLEAGQAQQVELTLLAWPTLTILVGEPGVELLVDGQRVGSTETAAPTVLTTIRPGRHTVVGRKGGRDSKHFSGSEPIRRGSCRAASGVR